MCTYYLDHHHQWLLVGQSSSDQKANTNNLFILLPKVSLWRWTWTPSALNPYFVTWSIKTNGQRRLRERDGGNQLWTVGINYFWRWSNQYSTDSLEDSALIGSLQLSATNRNIVDCCSSLHHQNKRIKIDDLFHGIFCGDLTDGGGGTVVLWGSFITHLSL